MPAEIKQTNEGELVADADQESQKQQKEGSTNEKWVSPHGKNQAQKLFEEHVRPGEPSTLIVYLWHHYWIEITVVGAILWAFVCFHIYRVHRKFQELKRKRQLQVEKGDPNAVDKKTHEELETAIRQTLGHKWADAFHHIVKYVFYSKNPIGVILYVGMMAFGYSYGYFFLIDEFCPGPFLSDIHKPLSLIIVMECWCSYFFVLGKRPMTCKEKMLLSSQDPERVKTDRRLEVFPYDGVFYEKGQECRTCKIPKLARSKHCSICDTCYDYFDHHCVWINACVTRSNLKAFIFFVFSHCLLTVYGGAVFFLALLGEVSKVNDTSFGQFFDVQTGFYAIYQYVWDFGAEFYRFGRKNWLLTALGSTCAMLGLTLPIFFGYHVSLVLKNRTTNEEMKVKKLKFGLNNQHIFFRAIIGKTKKLVQAFEEEQQKKAEGVETKNGLETKMVQKEENQGLVGGSRRNISRSGSKVDDASAEGDDKTNASEQKDDDTSAGKKEAADTPEPQKADENADPNLETKTDGKQRKNGKSTKEGKKEVVQLPRFKLDGVEIPQDPDKRIEFFEQKSEQVLHKMEILTGDASPYQPRTLKEAWQFLNA